LGYRNTAITELEVHQTHIGMRSALARAVGQSFMILRYAYQPASFLGKNPALGALSDGTRLRGPGILRVINSGFLPVAAVAF
jgi:hypothetical protein